MRSTCSNPVYPRYFADPFAWRAGESYYAIGTRPADAPIRYTGLPEAFPLLRSHDLVHWEERGFALVPPPPEYGLDFWAPEVAFADGTYFMYYSVGFGDKAHHLRVAESNLPEGPFVDNGQPLTTPQSCPFAIDASPFRDDDGTWYLFHARDFPVRSAGYEAGTGLVVDRLVDMRRLAGDLRVVARPNRPWQLFQVRREIYSQVLDWHTLEGPSVLRHEGRYYCFFSGGNWQNESYGVDYVVADHPLGPWHSDSTVEMARVLRTQADGLIGPGHNSFVAGPDGRTWMVYHAWDAGHTARRLCVSPLEWGAEGPQVIPS